MFRSVAIPVAVLYATVSTGCSSHEERVITATAAIQQALKIQPMLQKSRKCMAELSGWVPDPDHGPGVLATTVRDTHTQLTFECDQERSEFSVTIHYSFDDHTYVVGPFDGPLSIQYGHFTASRTKAIPANPDIQALAELLSDGS